MQYHGQIVDGLMHGSGKLQYENGDVYDGEFDHGKKQGYGTFNYHNGGKYVGACV